MDTRVAWILGGAGLLALVLVLRNHAQLEENLRQIQAMRFFGQQQLQAGVPRADASAHLAGTTTTGTASTAAFGGYRVVKDMRIRDGLNHRPYMTHSELMHLLEVNWGVTAASSNTRAVHGDVWLSMVPVPYTGAFEMVPAPGWITYIKK